MRPCIAQHLPPRGIRWESFVTLLGRANRAIARYDGILTGIPNPSVLLAPLTSQEAVLSSKIEGTRVTLGEVLKHEAGQDPPEESKRQDIHEIMNYRKALREAEAALKSRPFSLNLLKRLHETLLDSVRGRNKSRGRFRTTQNFIGPPGSTIDQALFVPPEPGHLPDLLDNWEKYYHEADEEPLVQLALVHAQFEIIHPFLDGNGRLGRILIPLFLYEREVLSKPMFYLSAYLEKHRDVYVRALRNLGGPEPRWNEWIPFFLEALLTQATANTAKAESILKLYDSLKHRVRNATHSQYGVHLLDNMFMAPVFRSSAFYGRPGMPSKPMLAHMLNQLKEEGILRVIRKGAGRRPRIFALAELVNLSEGRRVV